MMIDKPTWTTVDRLAAPVVWVYWLGLLCGLALHTATSGFAAPLWIGALAGTALGQCLAVRNFRLWVIACTALGTLAAGVGLGVDELGALPLWMAFLPAVVCGALALGDRGSLVAFWFPLVIWMHAILDRNAGSTAIDASGAVVLVGVVVFFIAYLYVRESRRIGLWRIVATQPLAKPTTTALLTETPGRHAIRGGWGVIASAIALAFTAWIAPRLWRIEVLPIDPANKTAAASCNPSLGQRCCEVDDEQPVRSRVEEYFDIGLGRDDHGAARPPRYVPCDDASSESGGGAGVGGEIYDVGVTEWAPNGGYAVGRARGASRGNAARVSTRIAEPGEVAVSQPHDERTGLETPTAAGSVAANTQPGPAGSHVLPSGDPEPIAAAPQPRVEPQPDPDPEPSRFPTTLASPPPPSAASARAAVPPERAREPDSRTLHWIAVLLAAGLAFQLLGLAMRPLRRLITLRHLRRPLWNETVDQRVSNWWQLALVGLRDAGWRTTTGESPREFAHRVGIDGVDGCATILERARHGVGIDHEDLSGMAQSAELAYRSGRGRIGPLARALAWLRWPLT